MLIQGDIYQENNEFRVNDGAKGETVNINGSTNEIFQVYDTVGLGEPPNGSVAHDEAVKLIRDYFSICEVPLNYIFYVKKKGRITEEDKKMFETFENIFDGAEKNFIIIITNCNPEWVETNSDAIKKNFGDYPILPVDFPWNEDDDDDDAQYHQIKRTQSLQILLNKLFELKYKGIELEVLSDSQKKEKIAASIIDFIPFIGSTYRLISAGVYYRLGKKKEAKKRLIFGAAGLALDIATVATAGSLIGIRLGKAAASTGRQIGAIAISFGKMVLGAFRS
jgi:hypothetical protein